MSDQTVDSRISALRIGLASPEAIRAQPGHVELAIPVPHRWFLANDESPIPLLLDLPRATIQRVIANRQTWITHVDLEQRDQLVASIRDEVRKRREQDERARADQLSTLASDDLRLVARLEVERDQLVAAVQTSPSIADWIAEVERRLRPTGTDARFDRLIDELHRRQEELRARLEGAANDRELVRRLVRRLHTLPLTDWYREQLAEPQRRVREIEDQLQEASGFGVGAESARAAALVDRLQHLAVGPAPADAELRAVDAAIGSNGRFFAIQAGTTAIHDLLRRLDLNRLARELRQDLRLVVDDPARRARLIRRLRLVGTLRRAGAHPAWLMLTVLPRLPVTLRSARDSADGRAASEPGLNRRYARVIELNQRLRDLLAGGAPNAALADAERALTKVVIDLIDALTARLSGPAGRIRHDLLSKRVDFSGRSVVVPAPELGLDQCGLPTPMALELFKPHVAGRLLAAGHAGHLEDAIQMVERAEHAAVDALDELLLDHLVLLSHAPPLGQPTVRAFEPLLIDGLAIRVHPLSATALGLEPDGTDDEAMVHVVLSEAARREARERLLPSRTVLDPANGEPAIAPSGDAVLGCYYLSTEIPGARGQGTRLADVDEARRYFDLGLIDLGARISVRLSDLPIHVPQYWYWQPTAPPAERPVLTDTTIGRIIFHQAVEGALRQLGHPTLPFRNMRLDKGGLREIVATVFRQHGHHAATAVLEAISRLGHHYATQSGISLGIDDFASPPEKRRFVEEADADTARVIGEFQRGLIAAQERHDDILRVWTQAKDAVTNAVDRALDPFGPLTMMAQSGTRGNIQQISQMSGMRGLVALPSGTIAELPIRSSYGEGQSPHEYFLGTYGAQKGRVGTQSREAQAVDLLRRLVAAAQDVVVSEEGCAADPTRPPGTWIEGLTDLQRRHVMLDQLVGRHLAGDLITGSTDEVLVAAGTLIAEAERDRIAEHQVARAYVRSPMTCESPRGVC